jgi:hypothetical protein
MLRKRRLHDGIVGVLVTAGVALAYWVDAVWLALPGVVGLLLIQSAFTGFCPVYYTLDKIGIGDRSPQSA